MGEVIWKMRVDTTFIFSVISINDTSRGTVAAHGQANSNARSSMPIRNMNVCSIYNCHQRLYTGHRGLRFASTTNLQ